MSDVAPYGHFTKVVAFFDEIFEQCDRVNELAERILATHPEGFDDNARKVYSAALNHANRMVAYRLELVEGLDSAVLTMTACTEKVTHERGKMRFMFGGLVLTLRGRVCLNPGALKKFVLNQNDNRLKRLEKKKKGKNKKQGSRVVSQLVCSASLTPRELWARLQASGKGEEDKLKTMWKKMERRDKRLLFIIVYISHINNMIYESLPKEGSIDHEKKWTGALKDANEKVAEVVLALEGVESVVLSLTPAKDEESYEGRQVVQMETEGKDGVSAIWIIVCGDKAIQFTSDLAEVATAGQEVHREKDGAKPAEQENAEGGTAARGNAVPDYLKHEATKQEAAEETKATEDGAMRMWSKRP